jgi:uncharacterized cupredoxin-like copper-binding protein
MKETALGITLCAVALAWAAPVCAQGAAPRPAVPAPHAHASAVGVPGDPKAVVRTVKVDLADTMRMTPALIEIRRGETIRFEVANTGEIKHEMTLGTAAELAHHAEEMRKFPEMEHDEPNNVSLLPGKTGDILWRFTNAGAFEFACLHPGHYDAGMRGRIVVR